MIVEKWFDTVVFDEDSNTLEEISHREQKQIKMPVGLKLLITVFSMLAILGGGGLILSFTLAGVLEQNWILWCLIPSVIFLLVAGNSGDILQDWIDDWCLNNNVWDTEIVDIYRKEQEQRAIAEKWRAEHPLEEKCRLAMMKNPNYVADLIRYVKEKNS